MAAIWEDSVTRPSAYKNVLWVCFILGAFTLSSLQFSRAAELSEAPHIGKGGVPQFEREPSWVKVPPAWTHGAVGTSVTFDDQNHIWLLTRPVALLNGGVINRSMMPGTERYKANPQPLPKPLNLPPSAVPPSVIEFDEAGNVLQSWGGKSGPGYVWPTKEHSIAPGPKGSLLILGFKDAERKIGEKGEPIIGEHLWTISTQLLKFTKTGKFISSNIGAANVKEGSNKLETFNGPTGIVYHAKTNEIFVSDGYMNSRIVVFDADTGKLKRMWGAYGNKPLDVAERQPLSAVNVEPFPPVVPPWTGVVERLQQFKDIHDIKISNDDLVYAADRGNRRVQVFTLDGKFIAEQFVGIQAANDFQAISLAFSPDQRFLYVAGAPVIRILNRETLEILGQIDISTIGRAHNMAVDHKGNIFLAIGYNKDFDGKPYGIGIQKYAFKGYSPATKCCRVIENAGNAQP